MAAVQAPGRRAAPTRRRRASGPTPVLRWVGKVVAWMVILASLAALAVGVLVPRLGGATAYTVLTGSMEPNLPPGTLVVMRPVPEDRIDPGSVITYQLRSGDPTVVTHRVVDQRVSLQGDVSWQTKGDANDSADERWVRPDQVKGELWYAVPRLGLVNQWLSGRQRDLVVLVVAGGLALYAGAMFAGAARDRRRKKGEEAP